MCEHMSQTHRGNNPVVDPTKAYCRVQTHLQLRRELPNAFHVDVVVGQEHMSLQQRGITTHDTTSTRRHKHGLSEQVSSTLTISTIDSVSYTV
mgnify:FL=1